MTDNNNRHQLIYDGKKITIIGTAHVSRESADLVERVIEEEKPETLPSPEALGIGYAAYLNGLGDVVGELRRHVLDLIRTESLEKAEVFLGIMENIHAVLMDFDYPDAITRGLRRKTDVARSLIEKTRGDLINAVQQKKLETAMRELESRLEPAALPEEDTGPESR